jgi:hypothetical protein
LRLNRQYEVDALKRNAAELQTARQQAQDELKAAQVQQAVANNMVTTAQLRASAAQQNLTTFDSQFFTPDVWNSMADQMRRLYRRYFHMALRSARLMQKAYNFETDQQLKPDQARLLARRGQRSTWCRCVDGRHPELHL